MVVIEVDDLVEERAFLLRKAAEGEDHGKFRSVRTSRRLAKEIVFGEPEGISANGTRAQRVANRGQEACLPNVVTTHQDVQALLQVNLEIPEAADVLHLNARAEHCASRESMALLVEVLSSESRMTSPMAVQ